MKIMKITLYPPKLYGNTLYSYTYPLELIFIWKLSWTEKVKTQVIFLVQLICQINNGVQSVTHVLILGGGKCAFL